MCFFLSLSFSVLFFISGVQKNIVHEKQGGVGYMMNRPSISQTNLRLSPMTAAMNHQSYVATAVSSQPLTGVPMANPVPAMPSSNSPVVGTTDLRYVLTTLQKIKSS